MMMTKFRELDRLLVFCKLFFLRNGDVLELTTLTLSYVLADYSTHTHSLS